MILCRWVSTFGSIFFYYKFSRSLYSSNITFVFLVRQQVVDTVWLSLVLFSFIWQPTFKIFIWTTSPGLGRWKCDNSMTSSMIVSKMPGFSLFGHPKYWTIGLITLFFSSMVLCLWLASCFDYFFWRVLSPWLVCSFYLVVNTCGQGCLILRTNHIKKFIIASSQGVI